MSTTYTLYELTDTRTEVFKMDASSVGFGSVYINTLTDIVGFDGQLFHVDETPLKYKNFVFFTRYTEGVKQILMGIAKDLEGV